MKNRKEKFERINKREFYRLNSLLGNDKMIFFILIGGREIGKSYSVTECYVRQYKKYHRPFYWLRLSNESKRKLLNNNAEKLVDPDLRRRFKLDLITNGDNVYNVLERDEKTGKPKKKELMAKVLDLKTFYNDKGSGLFDKDFLSDPNMYYNIALDEMMMEKNEKRFDILYSLVNQLENLVRSTKERMRVVMIGNLLSECSDILAAFNFIPQKFGRYYLKKKRCVIEYIQENEAYLNRRKGTIADILMPTASTFTNEIKMDSSLVNKKRCVKPTMIIKFSKEPKDWFTVWDGRIVHAWNKEKTRVVLPMKPYLDELYTDEAKNNVIDLFNQRVYQYKDLITFKRFEQAIALLKPSK